MGPKRCTQESPGPVNQAECSPKNIRLVIGPETSCMNMSSWLKLWPERRSKLQPAMKWVQFLLAQCSRGSGPSNGPKRLMLARLAHKATDHDGLHYGHWNSMLGFLMSSALGIDQRVYFCPVPSSIKCSAKEKGSVT